MFFLVLGVFLVLLVIIGTLFVYLSPQFGGSPSPADQERYASFEQFEDGKFHNIGHVEMSMGLAKGLSMLPKFLFKPSHTRPDVDLPIERITASELIDVPDSAHRLTWFGHSTFLLEAQGKRILLDPMMSAVPAPHPWLGAPRYQEELPIAMDDLPHIDAVLLSHDHYDHLDYESIIKLKDKVSDFYVPLGVGAHLKAWGVAADKIHELRWWETVKMGDFSFVCTPAQHFSGRGLSDRGATLWASWVIKSSLHSIFFSGDSGYGTHFKEIGDKYGPFDIALMECGQYNENWPEIHMMPEETVQAAIDIKSLVAMPIHWGAFTLALHSWTDPVERMRQKANALNLPITTPKIGEQFIIGNRDEGYPIEKWWESNEN